MLNLDETPRFGFTGADELVSVVGPVVGHPDVKVPEAQTVSFEEPAGALLADVQQQGRPPSVVANKDGYVVGVGLVEQRNACAKMRESEKRYIVRNDMQSDDTVHASIRRIGITTVGFDRDSLSHAALPIHGAAKSCPVLIDGEGSRKKEENKRIVHVLLVISVKEPFMVHSTTYVPVVASMANSVPSPVSSPVKKMSFSRPYSPRAK